VSLGVKIPPFFFDTSVFIMSFALESLLKRDRWVVGTGLVLIAFLSWGYLVSMTGDMPAMNAMQPGASAQDVFSFLWLFLMWAVMMVAMMTPSAAPMVLTFAALSRKQSQSSSKNLSTFVFLSGYLAVWTVFSLVAAYLQSELHAIAWLSPMMVSKSHLLSGGLLVLAGGYQWMPLKETCLQHCRSPFDFFMMGWKPGAKGAFQMGWHHGLYCVGCCWLLMLLLFVNGVMNLLWVGVLAALVLIEKVVPAGRTLSRTTGTVLIAWGLFLIFSFTLTG